jgi:hypothetical protein
LHLKQNTKEEKTDRSRLTCFRISNTIYESDCNCLEETIMNQQQSLEL